MNNVETQKMAITLTTGKLFAGKVNRAKEYYYMLFKLLQSYKRMYKTFYFGFEIFDKGYKETCMHFHGQIEVLSSEIYEYCAFIKEWERQSNCYQTESKIVFSDDDKWLKYVKKQSVISATYTKLRLKQFTEPKDIKSILKWSRPKECSTQTNVIDFIFKAKKREGAES